ncbi:MAG: hypothetical protein WCW17_01205 [Patescibacteria group bacterium]|jgi:hypothetical protein
MFNFVVFLLAFFLFIRPAYAYLDAGTGSLIIQAVVAFALGGLYVIKLFWGRIKKFITNILGKQ